MEWPKTFNELTGIKNPTITEILDALGMTNMVQTRKSNYNDLSRRRKNKTPQIGAHIVIKLGWLRSWIHGWIITLSPLYFLGMKATIATR